MKHLTAKDAAIADAQQQMKVALESRNASAMARAFKAEKEAMAMVSTVQCIHCDAEFEQGDELIICAVAICRKRKQEGGAVITEWLYEGDAKTPRNLAWCPGCADKLTVDSYITLR